MIRVLRDLLYQREREHTIMQKRKCGEMAASGGDDVCSINPQHRHPVSSKRSIGHHSGYGQPSSAYGQSSKGGGANAGGTGGDEPSDGEGGKDKDKPHDKPDVYIISDDDGKEEGIEEKPLKSEAEEAIPCRYCTRRLPKSTLSRHHNLMHEGHLCTCQHCNVQLDSPSQLLAHEATHGLPGDDRCPQCGYAFNHPGSLVTHLRLKHKKGMSQPTKKGKIAKRNRKK